MITFKINMSDCMKDEHTIEIIQGNSALITAQLVNSETGEYVFLEENDAILWYVKTVSGKEIAKRVFTKDDMNPDGTIKLELTPQDTLHIAPIGCGYCYGLSYSKNNGEKFLTFNTGRMDIVASCGAVTDLVSAKRI